MCVRARACMCVCASFVTLIVAFTLWTDNLFRKKPGCRLDKSKIFIETFLFSALIMFLFETQSVSL